MLSASATAQSQPRFSKFAVLSCARRNTSSNITLVVIFVTLLTLDF